MNLFCAVNVLAFLLPIQYQFLFAGASQQFRTELPASPVAEALLPVLSGVHWSSISVDLSVPAGSIWDQLCTLCLLPAGQNSRSSCCFPLSSAWCWSLDEVVWSRPTERKRLPIYIHTGANIFVFIKL